MLKPSRRAPSGSPAVVRNVSFAQPLVHKVYEIKVHAQSRTNPQRACLCAQLPWHAPSQAEFGYPFWSSNEREIRAWHLSREHAQLRRLSEEQRKGAADGKRKVEPLVRDEGAAAFEAPLRPENLEDSAPPARALEASFATCPSADGRELAAAAVAVTPTDPDASGLSSCLSQTGLNPPAAPPPLHNRSFSLRSSWTTPPAEASAQAQAPHDAPAKRKAVATPSRASRQRGPPRTIAPAVGTESASDAAAEPTTVALTAKVEPVSTQPADVGRPSGLPPPGWRCTVHEKSATNRAQYKRYEGPSGERAQSLKQAWAMHAQAASSAAAALAKSDGPEEPDAPAELAEEDEEEEEGEEEGEEEEGEEEEGEEVEDQPVEDHIPEGYERSPWKPGQPVRWFMLWQRPVTHSDVQWRFGKAIRELPWNKSFTHDAWLEGMPSGQKVGVDLASCHHDEGSWVMLSKKA